MTTKYYDFTGTIAWANSQYGGLFQVDPKYNKYKCHLYLDPESWEKFKKSGLRIKTYNDDGGDYIQLKRDDTKLIKGKQEHLGPPKVFFVEGIEPTRDIGNGSGVTANVAVFDTANGKGHRLERVIVTDLVTFERGGFDETKYGALSVEDDEGEDKPNIMDKEELEEGDEVVEEDPKPVTVKKTPFRR